jgi:hypothetical protein
MLLTKATVCAILANAGPQRSRILGTLYADERTRTLDVHWPVLEKMFMQRILKSEEVKVRYLVCLSVLRSVEINTYTYIHTYIHAFSACLIAVAYKFVLRSVCICLPHV